MMAMRSRIARGLDAAAYSVDCAAEAHKHCGDPVPSRWDNLVYWCQGFVAGVAGESHRRPLRERIRLMLARMGQARARR